MSIFTINKAMTQDEGESEGILCPECKKATNLRLFKLADNSKINKIINKNGSFYFAVCPLCSTVFDINENYMKEKKNGTTVIITESDLKKR